MRALKIIGVVLLAGALGFGALALRALITDLPDPGATAPAEGARSILFLDRNGRPLYEAIDPDGNKNVPLPLEQIPVACRDATIATEDSRFYAHHGVDPLAIARAVIQDAYFVLRGEQSRFAFSGASTLTQQLARNLYLDAEERHERSLRRKLREAWLAWRLEQTRSKDELLALYLNTTYYGHFATGIEAAAQAYFGVGAAELDLAQCALLAGLPQYPTGYNPIENPDGARARQQVVLGLMVEAGYISTRQAEDAGYEALAYAATPFPIEAPHFVMWVNSQLPTLLDADTLRRGGLRVTTTLDLDQQRLAEQIIRRRLQQLRPCTDHPDMTVCDPEADPLRRVENAALTALDPASGAVRVMVGSPDYFDARISGAVNATLAHRQPGSAIKPLTYAAAFDPMRAGERGEPPWTAATLIADLRTAFPTDDGRPYVPQNYDLRHHGPVTARLALANSYNIPAVKALQAVGVDALLDQAERLGINWRAAGPPQPARAAASGAEPSGAARYGLALTLGGGEVSLLELTTAYAAFTNGGNRVAPHGIARIETLDGRVLYEAATDEQLAPRAALDPRVAFLITDILSDDLARRPAFGADNPLELGFAAAAKTGTTTDWRDNWTIGFTPTTVVGVWVGNADNTPMLDVSGVSGAGPIWHDFLVQTVDASQTGRFPIPEGMTHIEVCADSGLPPARVALAAGQEGVIPCPYRRMEWFIAGTEPIETDRSHILVQIDVRTGGRAGATSQGFTTGQAFWVLPAEYQAWASENDIPQPPTEDVAWVQVNNGLPETTGELRLTSPEPNRVYRLDPLLPREDQAIPVTVYVPSALEPDSVTLFADGEAIARVSSPVYSTWWVLQSGEHTLQAVAIRRDGSRLTSAPVVIRVVE